MTLQIENKDGDFAYLNALVARLAGQLSQKGVQVRLRLSLANGVLL
jgi:hypothetical protein